MSLRHSSRTLPLHCQTPVEQGSLALLIVVDAVEVVGVPALTDLVVTRVVGTAAEVVVGLLLQMVGDDTGPSGSPGALVSKS